MVTGPSLDTVTSPAASEDSPRARQAPRLRSPFGDSWAWLGLTPFAAYLMLFLALPTILAIGSGLFDGDGAFTWNNFSALADPVVLKTLGNSVWLSVLTAIVGAVLGALACYAMLGLSTSGFVRTSVDSLAGTLAQFGGVMLAFAFIATIGLQGVVTVFLRQSLGIDIFSEGAWIYDLPGLILPYIYFQVPLMIITFMPALSALKPQWAEANATLGGTRGSFWLKIGIPVLAPSFLGRGPRQSGLAVRAAPDPRSTHE